MGNGVIDGCHFIAVGIGASPNEKSKLNNGSSNIKNKAQEVSGKSHTDGG